MATITGGMVRFNQRLKTGDFEWKEAAAELTFSAAEGESFGAEEHDAFGERAVNQVAKMLRLTPKAPPGRPRIPAPVKPSEAGKIDEPVTSSTPSTSELVQTEPTSVPVEDVTEANVPPVTDADLHTRVAAKAEAFTQAKVETGPKAIKGLIRALGVPPSPGAKILLGMVPQNKRREFLERLDALTGTEVEP